METPELVLAPSMRRERQGIERSHEVENEAPCRSVNERVT